MLEINLQERSERRREMRRNQTYKAFLGQLAARSGLSEEDAERAAVSVLCVLEQRLLSGESAHLEAQLPAMLRDLMAQCERHEAARAQKFGQKTFIQRVSEDLGVDALEAERRSRCVLETVRARVSEGEIEDVMGQLPADLRELWRPAV